MCSSKLLPGLRDLRAPLAAGSIWLLAIWLAMDWTPPDAAHATGIWRNLSELDGVVGAVGRGAALAFGVYLLGSISEAVISGIATWVPRFAATRRDFKASGLELGKPLSYVWFGNHKRFAIRSFNSRARSETGNQVGNRAKRSDSNAGNALSPPSATNGSGT